MAGRGSGIPIFFRCPVARRNRHDHSSHRVKLTGRTKPRPHDGNLGQRTSTTNREYQCECGHLGWSTHIDLEEMEKRHAKQ